MEWYPITEKCNENPEVQVKLVIVNDGGKDETYAILQHLSKTRPDLIPLTKENGGQGSALLFGYQYVLKKGPIMCFRQIQTDRQILMNLPPSGACGKRIMPFSETVPSEETAGAVHLWRRHSA